MARLIDKSKVDRLKKSTMELVVERGYGGASATLIAKKARIAVGYFYLHYKNKYELVNSLLHDVYKELLGWFETNSDENTSFIDTIDLLIKRMIDYANEDPVKVKFLYVLTNDYTFELNQEIYTQCFTIIQEIHQLGINNEELDPQITEKDLFLILFINTIQYINQQYRDKQVSVLELTEADTEHLSYLVKKILRK